MKHHAARSALPQVQLTKLCATDTLLANGADCSISRKRCIGRHAGEQRQRLLLTRTSGHGSNCWEQGHNSCCHLLCLRSLSRVDVHACRHGTRKGALPCMLLLSGLVLLLQAPLLLLLLLLRRRRRQQWWWQQQLWAWW